MKVQNSHLVHRILPIVIASSQKFQTIPVLIQTARNPQDLVRVDKMDPKNIQLQMKVQNSHLTHRIHPIVIVSSQKFQTIQVLI
jgi:hypothetical protein